MKKKYLSLKILLALSFLGFGCPGPTPKGIPPKPVTYNMSGAVGGTWVAGDSVTLQFDGANDTVITNPSSTFSFGSLSNGTTHSVTILNYTVASGGKCFIGNGTRRISGADITDIVVTCGAYPNITDGLTTIHVTWPASRSYDVTTAPGGGYKIYYDLSSNVVNKSTPFVIDVPNTAGTTTVITGVTAAQVYTVGVCGYSKINPDGGPLITASVTAN